MTFPQRTPLLGALFAFAALLLAVTLLSGCAPRIVATPASVMGSPVRAVTVEGDRVYLLTSQWKTTKSFRSGLTSGARTELLIDVWAFDAATGKPAWRRRLEAVQHGVNMGRRLLGVQGGVLWLIQPSGLMALSLKDGSTAGDAARVEAANPGLAGQLPKEEGFYHFDGAGLVVTAADGRFWRLDGKTLKGRLDDPPTTTPLADAAMPARLAGGVGSSMFMTRSIDVGERWLGMMTEAEAQKAAREGMGGLDWNASPRQRLWSARAHGAPQWPDGPRAYSAFAVLPQSPEFLHGALLSDGGSGPNHAILLFKPDSVLVLHVDRLDDAGRLQLTRVTGPLGKPAWAAALPIARLEAVMPGKTTLVLLGSRDGKTDARGEVGETISVPVLLTIDLATGAVTPYAFNIPATKPEDIPPSSGR